MKSSKNNIDSEINAIQPEKKDDEVSISTAIASVLVIIFITCAVIGFYFAYGKDKIEENNIKKQLRNISGETLIEMYCDDFNGDGSKEVFAVTGTGSSTTIVDGTLWYVKGTVGLNVKSDFSGTINGIITDKNKKYLSIDLENENGEIVSLICGVNRGSEFYQPAASGKFRGVHQQDGRILTDTGKEVNLENPEY